VSQAGDRTGPSRRLSLRPARPGDSSFLYRVFASTRESDLALLPWTHEEKDSFLRQQFTAQDTHYRQAYPQADLSVILAGGEAVGRLYVDRSGPEIVVVDISLLPDHRNRGIGTQLLEELQAEAEAARVPVMLHVEMHNPAQRLYARLGFMAVDKGELGVYKRLRWRARDAVTSR
jgi:ribosomal protein S18 acetylase RimI-like enzyme